MTESAVVRRRAERAQRIDAARSYAEALADRRPDLVAVVVVGSVARRDFNRWSDLDLLVVADDLPDGWLARAAAVAPVPPGVQPICWTPAELSSRRHRREPIAVEADGAGVTVWGSLPGNDRERG